MLEAEELTFSYERRRSGRPVLDRVSLRVAPGERVGILAPSGTGKTTLMKILGGYLRPDAGRVSVDGQPLPSCGYCPVQMIWQHPEKAVNPRLRLRKILEEGDRLEEGLLERLGIEEGWKERYPRELSGGELQRFCIARALGQRTRYLLADEISTMLDLITQGQIWRFLMEETYKRQRAIGLYLHQTGAACAVSWRAAAGGGMRGRMDAQEVLLRFKSGEMTLEEAEAFFKKEPFEELAYAKLDSHRKLRSGVAEVVFCSGKADAHLLSIYERLYEAEGEVLGTRATAHQYELVRERFPQVSYDGISKILKIEKEGKERIGEIAVCTAGTADIPVAEEAAQTAEFFGSRVERIYDVGVSGLHRLLSRLDVIQSANCVVAVAGMEGALASVIGGLVSNPVLAVPTSVGYGASMHGLSALLTMINSCANGIAVLNIDNGYGAGYMATQINRLASKQRV